MKKYFLGFLVGVFFMGSLFQFNIGLPSFNKANTKKTTKAIKNKKAKLKKNIFKKTTRRATDTIMKTAIPLPFVGAGIAGATIIAITADDYCETQNTLDNIILLLEGKAEKEVSIAECSEKIIKDSEKTILKSGTDINQWIKRKYGSASDLVSNQWKSTFGK